MTFVYSQRILILGLILFSLLMSLAFLIFLKNVGPEEHQEPGTDYFTRYSPMTQTLLEGEGIPLQKDIGAPGYSFLLLPIFFASDTFAISPVQLTMFVNTIFAALTALVLFSVVRYAFPLPVAVLASLAWASYPLNLWFIKNPHTEAPFFLFFLLAIWLYLKGITQRHFFTIFAGGLLLGFATLIRPVTFYLPFLLFLAVFFLAPPSIKREGLSLHLATLFLLGNIVILMPWIGYIYNTTGKFVPVSTIGKDAILTGLTYAFIGDGSHKTSVPSDVRAFMERARSQGLTTQTDVIAFTLKEFVQHPISLIKLLGLKVVRSWYATAGIWWEKELLMVQLPYLISGVFGIWFALRRQKRNSIIAFFLILIGYFWLISIAAVSIIRYTMPAMLMLMPFCALTLFTILDRFTPLPQKFSFFRLN